MIKVRSTYSPDNTLKKQWLVRLIQRYMNKPIGDATLYVASSFGTTVSFAVFYLISVYISRLSLNKSLLPTYTEWLVESSGKNTAFFVACFFAILTLYVLNSSVFYFFSPRTNPENIGHKHFWSPLKVLVAIAFLIFCVWMSGVNLAKYYANTTLDSRDNSEQVAVFNNVEGSSPYLSESTNDNSALLLLAESQYDAEKLKNTDIEKLDKALKLIDENFMTKQKKQVVADAFNNISLFSNEEPQDWELFLKKVDSTAESTPGYESLVILKGIFNGAPFDTLVELLDRGYKLDGNHANMLASKLTSNELKMLENYGVDFTISDSSGSNALVESLTNWDNDDVFDYLLQKDELVFSKDVDVLQEAMKFAAMIDFDLDRVEKLLDRGAIVTQETRKWVNNDLKDLDYEMYLTLKDKINL